MRQLFKSELQAALKSSQVKSSKLQAALTTHAQPADAAAAGAAGASRDGAGEGEESGVRTEEESDQSVRQSFGSDELRNLFEADGHGKCDTLHALLAHDHARAAAASARSARSASKRSRREFGRAAPRGGRARGAVPAHGPNQGTLKV